MCGFIKICGLGEPAHLDAAITAGASHAGFVFYPKSPRNIKLDKAAQMAAAVREKIRIVALVVDPAAALLDEIQQKLQPHAVQFHGGESPQFLSDFNHKTGAATQVWKALSMADGDDLTAAQDYFAHVDMLLFDARPPKGATRPGGHGAAFDWSLLNAYNGPTPWLLAGGLSPDNAAAAIAACQTIPGFAGVDVSSGVESAPGKKDAALIKRFVSTARAAFQEGSGKC